MTNIKIMEITGVMCAVDYVFTSKRECEGCKHFLGTRVGDKGIEVICGYQNSLWYD